MVSILARPNVGKNAFDDDEHVEKAAASDIAAALQSMPRNVIQAMITVLEKDIEHMKTRFNLAENEKNTGVANNNEGKQVSVVHNTAALAFLVHGAQTQDASQCMKERVEVKKPTESVNTESTTRATHEPNRPVEASETNVSMKSNLSIGGFKGYVNGDKDDPVTHSKLQHSKSYVQVAADTIMCAAPNYKLADDLMGASSPAVVPFVLPPLVSGFPLNPNTGRVPGQVAFPTLPDNPHNDDASETLFDCPTGLSGFSPAQRDGEDAGDWVDDPTVGLRFKLFDDLHVAHGSIGIDSFVSHEEFSEPPPIDAFPFDRLIVESATALEKLLQGWSPPQNKFIETLDVFEPPSDASYAELVKRDFRLLDANIAGV